MFRVFIGLFFIGICTAQVPFLGSCPQLETKADFDVTKVKAFGKLNFFSGLNV